MECITSSAGTAPILAAHARVIGGNVIGNMIISYVKLVETEDGCDWVSVLCIDVGGSLPDKIKKLGVDFQVRSQEVLIYVIKNGKVPPK